MKWEKPSFIDVPMNAEIGSYQDDFGGDDAPSFVKRRASAALQRETDHTLLVEPSSSRAS